MDLEGQPIAAVEWVDPATLHSNDYNPNRVFGAEMQLLKRSLLDDGWTAAILATVDNEVVDGFHRWSLGLHDPEVREATGGLVPVVRARAGKTRAQLMATTVRHNRARGKHGILKMGEIVRSMEASGMAPEEVESQLGMEDEERERLAELRGMPEQTGKDSFGKGWVPTTEGSLMAVARAKGMHANRGGRKAKDARAKAAKLAR